MRVSPEPSSSTGSKRDLAPRQRARPYRAVTRDTSSGPSSPCAVAFTPAEYLSQASEAELGRALHLYRSGRARSHCRAERLAFGLQTGGILCGPMLLPRLPSAAAARACISRLSFTHTGGAEGALHQRLRGGAIMLLAALVPGGHLEIEARPLGPEQRGRRPDVRVQDAAGATLVAEVGTTDADSIYQQLTSGSATHVVALPYPGVFGGTRSPHYAQGYQFRLAGQAPLASPSTYAVHRAWSALMARASSVRSLTSCRDATQVGQAAAAAAPRVVRS